MKKNLLLSSMALLTACATTPKSPTTPLTPEQRKANVEQFIASHYITRFNDKIPLTAGTVEVIGRDKVSDRLTPTEPNLMIIKRSDTTKANSLNFLSSIVVGGGRDFGKNDLKGHILEPQLANPTLELARPQLTTWVAKNTPLLSLNTRPLQRVSIEPERFYLIYEKYMSDTGYQLVNGMTITLQNTWEPEKSFTYKCDKTSPAYPLNTWQQANYAIVKTTVQQNIASCLADLDKKQADILTKLRS